MLKTIFFSILSFITGAYLVANNVGVEFQQNYKPWINRDTEECVSSVTVDRFIVTLPFGYKARIK